MRGRKRLISGVLSFVLLLGVAIPAYATDLENQRDELQTQVDQANAEKKAFVIEQQKFDDMKV